MEKSYLLTITLEDESGKNMVDVEWRGDGKLDQWLMAFRQALIEYGLVENSIKENGNG
jgi:hypothetical protein